MDINAGCPVKKCCAPGSGAALMKEPAILEAIVRRSYTGDGPGHASKIRFGLTAGEVISPRLALVIEGAGASAITLHGRAASNFHAGPVDYDALAATAAAVKVPVFGNGGVAHAPTPPEYSQRAAPGRP